MGFRCRSHTLTLLRFFQSFTLSVSIVLCTLVYRTCIFHMYQQKQMKTVFASDLCGFMDFSAFNIKQSPNVQLHLHTMECVYFDTTLLEKFAFHFSSHVLYVLIRFSHFNSTHLYRKHPSALPPHSFSFSLCVCVCFFVNDVVVVRDARFYFIYIRSFMNMFALYL